MLVLLCWSGPSCTWWDALLRGIGADARLPAGQLDCTLCGVIGGVLPGILRVLSGGAVAAFHVFGGLLRHFAAECLAVSGYWAARGLQ